MEYADYEYYVESYLLGRQPDIPESTFRYYEKQAEKEIDRVTFDRAKRMETPKEVKDCVCDVAELIYKAEQYGGSDAPGPLASYGNDGGTGTYDLSRSVYTEEGKRKKIREIIEKHLGNTGLMYLGVD